MNRQQRFILEEGSVKELPKIVGEYGTRVLLVTSRSSSTMKKIYEDIIVKLKKPELEVPIMMELYRIRQQKAWIME